MKHFDKFSNTISNSQEFSYREVQSLTDEKVRPLRSSTHTAGTATTEATGDMEKSVTPLDYWYTKTVSEAKYIGQARSIWTGTCGDRDFIYVLWRRSLEDKGHARVPWPDFSMNKNKKAQLKHNTLTKEEYLRLDPEEEQNWELYNNWHEQFNFLDRVRFLTNNIFLPYREQNTNKDRVAGRQFTDTMMQYAGMDYAEYRSNWSFSQNPRSVTSFKATDFLMLGTDIDYYFRKWSSLQQGEDDDNQAKETKDRLYGGKIKDASMARIDAWVNVFRRILQSDQLYQSPKHSFNWVTFAEPRAETAIKTYEVQNGKIELVSELSLPLCISDFWYAGAAKQDNPTLMDFFHLDGYNAGDGEKNLLVASLGCEGIRTFIRKPDGSLDAVDSFGERKYKTESNSPYTTFLPEPNLNPEGNSAEDAQPWEKWCSMPPYESKSVAFDKDSWEKYSAIDSCSDITKGFKQSLETDQNRAPYLSDGTKAEDAEGFPSIGEEEGKIPFGGRFYRDIDIEAGSLDVLKTAFLPTPPLKIIATKVKLHKRAGDAYLRLFVPNLGHLNFTRLNLEDTPKNEKVLDLFPNPACPPVKKLKEGEVRVKTKGDCENKDGFYDDPTKLGRGTSDIRASWALGGCFSSYVSNWPSLGYRCQPVQDGFIFPKNWAIGYNPRDITYIYEQGIPQINNIYQGEIDASFALGDMLEAADSNEDSEISASGLKRQFQFLDAVRKKGIGGVAVFRIDMTTGLFERGMGSILFTQNDRSDPETRFAMPAAIEGLEGSKAFWDARNDSVAQIGSFQRMFPGKTNTSYQYYKKLNSAGAIVDGNSYDRLPYSVGAGGASAAIKLDFLKELGANGPGSHPCSDLDIEEVDGEIYIVTNGFNAPFYDMLIGRDINTLLGEGYKVRDYHLYNNRSMLAEMLMMVQEGSGVLPIERARAVYEQGGLTNQKFKYGACGNNHRFLFWRWDKSEWAQNQPNNPYKAEMIAKRTGFAGEALLGSSVQHRPFYRNAYTDLAFNGSRFPVMGNTLTLLSKGVQSWQIKGKPYPLNLKFNARTASDSPDTFQTIWFSGGAYRSTESRGEDFTIKFADADPTNRDFLGKSFSGADGGMVSLGGFDWLVGVGINNASASNTETWFPTVAEGGLKVPSLNVQGVNINWLNIENLNDVGKDATPGKIYDAMPGASVIDNSLFGGAILNHGGIRVYEFDPVLDEMVFVKNKMGGPYPFYLGNKGVGFKNNIFKDGESSEISYPPELMKKFFRRQSGEIKPEASVDITDPDLVKCYKNQVGGGNHYGTSIQTYLDSDNNIQILSGNERKALRQFPAAGKIANTNFYAPGGALAGYNENDKINHMVFDIGKSKVETSGSDGWVNCLEETSGMPHIWKPYKYTYHRTINPMANVKIGDKIKTLFMASWHPTVFNTRGLFSKETIDGKVIVYQADGVFEMNKRGVKEIIHKMMYAIRAGETPEYGMNFEMCEAVRTYITKKVNKANQHLWEYAPKIGPCAGGLPSRPEYVPGIGSNNKSYNVDLHGVGKVYSIKKLANHLLVGFGSEFEPRFPFSYEGLVNDDFGGAKQSIVVDSFDPGEVILNRMQKDKPKFHSELYTSKWTQQLATWKLAYRRNVLGSGEKAVLRIAVMKLYKGNELYTGTAHLENDIIKGKTTRTLQ